MLQQQFVVLSTRKIYGKDFHHNDTVYTCLKGLKLLILDNNYFYSRERATILLTCLRRKPVKEEQVHQKYVFDND